MRRNNLIVALILVFTLSASLFAQADKSRDDVADKYKWDLTPLYKDMDSWTASKKKLSDSFSEFKKFRGKLGNSAEDLEKCMIYFRDVLIEFNRLESYASRLSDIDKRQPGPLAMEQGMSQLGTKLNSLTAFINPEILAIDKKTLENFIKEKPALKDFRQYFDDIQRLKKYTLTVEEEKIIATAGMMAGSPSEVYSVFANAEMPRATIEINGKEVVLDASGYSGNRASSDREIRQRVFEAFFGKLKEFNGTLGTNLYTEVKKDIFYKNVRGYESSLKSALNENNIPTSVYTALIKSAHKNLPTLHRYLNLRKKMLGIKELHYYDMYPPLVPSVDLTYSVEEAQDIIKKALKPLGSEYISTLDIAFNNRWIDMFPNPGKRSGAYSTGNEYEVHPYILMNYNGEYNDVSTLAHELGHTMHSYFSNKNQPFINSRYPIFLAEVASTANENLLIEYVLKQIKDPQKRLALLGNQLESFRTTLFRQTMFAESELKIHEIAEKGESLTGENMSKIYLELLKQYYGHDKGVTVIEDLYGIEWAYIPHFYYNFYVFQYATSYCASVALAENMLDGGPKMVDRYINDFLSAGSSEYAIPILKKVGVDMTTEEPFNKAMAKMNLIMDEIEKLLDK